jgi:hypothetical protein
MLNLALARQNHNEEEEEIPRQMPLCARGASEGNNGAALLSRPTRGPIGAILREVCRPRAWRGLTQVVQRAPRRFRGWRSGRF